MTEEVQHITCWPPPSQPDITTSVPVSASSVKHTQVNVTKRSAPEAGYGCERHSIKKLRMSDAEPLAKVSLAKWWRSYGNKVCNRLEAPMSKNPNTLLYILSREREGQDYLRKEVKRLSKKLLKTSGRPDVHAALGSVYQFLGDLKPAHEHLQNAAHGGFQDKEVLLLLEQLNKQISALQSQQSVMNCHQPTLHGLNKPFLVEIKSGASFSYQDFLFNFAMTGTPVIISGLAAEVTTVPWDLQHVKNIGGGCQVTVKRPVPMSVEWAKLEDDVTMTVSDYIDSLPGQATLSPKDQKYLFDWSLPLHCPKLAEELVIPKYFAGDFLQRTPPGTLYQDCWPSLFVAPKGIQSELHVDAFGSNFWMALFEGRKKWTFYPREDTPLLYPSFCHSLDPIFECDLTEPDFQKYPLLQRAHPRECILEAGQVLFVPAGCPHRVENLENSLAVSANYVDLSNLKLVIEELRVNQLVDDRAAELCRQLEHPTFNTKMDGNIKHMPMKLFKKYPKDYSQHNY